MEDNDFFQTAFDRDESKRPKKSQYERDLKTVLETEHGRLVIWALLEKFGLYNETFCGENTHQSAFSQGRTSAARQLLSDVIAADSRAYLKMMQEKANKEDSNEN